MKTIFQTCESSMTTGIIINTLSCKTVVVLDAYSGVGTIGLIAARNAKKVISVEINKDAHRNAIENAKRNNISNIEFYCDDAGKFIANYDKQLDIVIMDPPRKGSDEVFLQTLIDRKISNIIYVSCDPETLARDIEYLSPYFLFTTRVWLPADSRMPACSLFSSLP